jgi:hypothetical protein
MRRVGAVGVFPGVQKVCKSLEIALRDAPPLTWSVPSIVLYY